MEWFNWVEQVLRNYAQFNGRSRRKEYWYFMLRRDLSRCISPTNLYL